MKRKKLTEADVTAESVFMLQRRQVLKMLGISATALSLPAAAQADLLDWFKGHDRPPAPAGKALELSLIHISPSPAGGYREPAN